MNKSTALLNYFLLILISTLALAGCANTQLNKMAFKKPSQDSDYDVFDTNPNHYKLAKATQNISLPKYIADNIEPQALYPLESTKLQGDLTITPVPPSLRGKITEY